MKIVGDESNSQFQTLTQAPGTFFGYDDVLEAEKGTVRRITISMFGKSDESYPVHPKLYLHISNSAWSSFTGFLREYCMPWRWQTAYLEQGDGTPPRPILVCTSVHDGELSARLSKLLGKSLLIANLIKSDRYDEIMYQEFLLVPMGIRLTNKVIHPLGEWFGVCIQSSSNQLCHIFRARGIISFIKYYFLKYSSNGWEEVSIRMGQVSETLLILREDREAISKLGLLAQ